MRDAERYTVDDPRFSTAQVVGPSMLSLDGETHRRHRDPFAEALRGPDLRERLARRVADEAARLVATLAPAGTAEIRRDLAGPLAVKVVADALDLLDAAPGTVLGWYDEIVAAVDRVSVGGEIGPDAQKAVDALGRHVAATIGLDRGVLGAAARTLAEREVVSNAAVMMFGGIETSEGMTTSVFWHLLSESGRAGRPAAGPLARRERHRGIASPGARRRACRPICHGRYGACRRPDPARRPRHRVADGRQSRPIHISRPGPVRPFEAELAVAPCLRPGSARVYRQPPREARDPGRPGRRARRVARDAPRRGRHATDRGRVPEAEVAPRPVGCMTRCRGRYRPGIQRSSAPYRGDQRSLSRRPT